jgi:hypothetical protein
MEKDINGLLHTASTLGTVLAAGRDAEGKATYAVIAYVGDRAQEVLDTVNALFDRWEQADDEAAKAAYESMTEEEKAAERKRWREEVVLTPGHTPGCACDECEAELQELPYSC